MRRAIPFGKQDSTKELKYANKFKVKVDLKKSYFGYDCSIEIRFIILPSFANDSAAGSRTAE